MFLGYFTSRKFSSQKFLTRVALEQKQLLLDLSKSWLIWVSAQIDWGDPYAIKILPRLQKIASFLLSYSFWHYFPLVFSLGLTVGQWGSGLIIQYQNKIARFSINHLVHLFGLFVRQYVLLIYFSFVDNSHILFKLSFLLFPSDWLVTYREYITCGVYLSTLLSR